jgi:hypothetical protein
LSLQQNITQFKEKTMPDVYKDFQREPSRAHQCMHESEKDGTRCRAMSMANNYMCYAHRTDEVVTVIENDMFVIDDLSTHEAIQKSLCDVAARLACNHIDLKRAELLITLLRAASRNLRDAGIAHRQAFREAAAEAKAAAAEAKAAAKAAAAAEEAAAEAAPRPPSTWPVTDRIYTAEEKEFLLHATDSNGYKPCDHPRPASLTDDDIIAAINAGRFDCGMMEPIETEPNWNRETLSARTVTPAP